MTHASLFSGIGGFDYAAALLGWINIFDCEIDAFCRKVLEYHFPNSVHYGDITKQIFKEWRGKIDVLSGGFPCQPFSLAGQRKGADDNRYFWPEMLRVIREIRPTWVVGENVAGILMMVQPGAEVEVGGQASLFGEDYRKRVLHRQEYVIETIFRDLECEGYSVQPLLIPACAVGAPHRRDRIWFVAFRTDARHKSEQSGEELSDKHELIADTKSEQSKRMQFKQSEISKSESREFGRDDSKKYFERTDWSNFPTQSPICNRNDGLSDRLVNISFPRWRNEAIKAMGNSWVPEVAYQIFKVINQIEYEAEYKG